VRTDLHRIDVHHHALPAPLRTTLEQRGLTAGGWALPTWSPEGSLASMDRQGIAAAALSVSAPGVHFGDDAKARNHARASNDALAEVVRMRPDRFGFFAALPLPDVDGALEEAVRALDELGADGIGLLANSRGQYISDPAVEPLIEELDRRGATIFVHPNVLPGGSLPGLPAPVADFTLDTTRAAFGLVLSGATSRFRRLRIILAHAGGLVPFLAHRFVQTISSGVDPSADPNALLAGLQRFYLDTALASSPTSLPSVLAFTGSDHLLYGSDLPFASDRMSQWFTEQLDIYRGISEEDAAQIAHRTAREVFPRLAGTVTRAGVR
jgi:predicted TIM-barrel fold metal-dependent hydrolase